VARAPREHASHATVRRFDMSAFEEIDPQEAHRRMTDDPSTTYLDVRTVEEFADGHAHGAVNVPIAVFGCAGMEMNDDFVRIVAAKFAKDAKLVVGCKMGGRSRRACDVLAGAGYTRLANVDGGFGGNPGAAKDSARKGWQRAGLPVSTTPAPGATYDEMKQHAR
jgi:rhodanese-related sulfurtransferase